jgi:hypothetical protein
MVTPQSDIGEWDQVVDSHAVVGDDDLLNDQVQDFLFRLKPRLTNRAFV